MNTTHLFYNMNSTQLFSLTTRLSVKQLKLTLSGKELFMIRSLFFSSSL